jgi:hypothetical protein
MIVLFMVASVESSDARTGVRTADDLTTAAVTPA